MCDRLSLPIYKFGETSTFLDTKGERITEQNLAGVQRIDYSRAIPDAPGKSRERATRVNSVVLFSFSSEIVINAEDRLWLNCPEMENPEGDTSSIPRRASA